MPHPPKRNGRQPLLLSLATLLSANLSGCAAPPPACPAVDDRPLRLIAPATHFMVQTPHGPLRIQRVRTACAAADGALQAMTPWPGVRTVGEIDVLHAMNDPAVRIVDMRDFDEPVPPSLPNSYHIAYNEVEDRMDELGCRKLGKTQWDCQAAAQVLVYCHGPMCLQSPAGIRAMVQAGLPPERISYYRGGLLDWQALGLPTVTTHLPPRKTAP